MNLRKTCLPLTLLIGCFLHLPVRGQNPLSSLRNKTIPVKPGKINIDTTSIVPGTFQMEGIPPSAYSLDHIKAVLEFLSMPASDSVTITYRIFPVKLNPEARGFNYDSIRYHFLAEPVTVKTSSFRENRIIDFGGFRADGSIGRAISFGNAQDAVVNSSMNLQLHGYIGDSLEIKAAITDNNIPVQPEGNTQDLRDFDRILIQMGKKNWQVSFGDIEVRESKDRFLSFYKRLQGGDFRTITQLGKGKTNSIRMAGAIAKGKYNRNIFNGIEGNQGPYRLQGANNELYFVVLAGTERVYIDGEMLQRGEDRDYVINYNTAEVTFTARRMVQKDVRIQVEFEYADRNYLNSQLYVQDEFSKGEKFKFRISAYSNADSRNATIDQPLDPAQKQFLAGIGDSISKAYYDTETPETYRAGILLYRKVDTVFNGGMRDTVYVLSSDSTQTLYNVSFTYLGPGKGNYSRLLNAANGKAFQWVMPDSNNNKRGDWEAASLLVTPKRLRIVTASVSYQLAARTQMAAEYAISDYDVNLYSSADKADNAGRAYKVGLQQELGNMNWAGRSWKMSAGGGHEFVSGKFRPAERLRTVEFLRDWSLPYDVMPQNENLSTAFFQVHAADGGKLRYEATRYDRQGSYTGYKQILEQFMKFGNWQFTGRLNLLRFKATDRDGSFFRPYAEMKRLFPSLKNLEFLARYSGEYNRPMSGDKDSLAATAFGFEVFQATLTSGRELPNKWDLTYFRRQDRLPSGNAMVRVNHSDNMQMNAELYKNLSHQLRLNFHFRKMTVENTALSKEAAEESMLGRVEYGMRWFKGLAAGNWFYELGSGRELKRDFSYVQVPAGQGEYTWIDYNNNGIEELNEFETAVYQDQKKYIRIFTPGVTYVKAHYLQFNYSIDLDPAAVIKSKTGLRKILSRTGSSSALQIGRKNLAGSGILFDPFAKNLNDSNLLTYSSFLSNTLFYNRTSAQWGLEATHSLASGKALLVYGFESRKTENFISKARARLSRNWTCSFSYKAGRDVLSTDNPGFLNRNYDIRRHTFEPALTYLFKSNFRSVFTWALTEKHTVNGAGEKVKGNNLSAEIRYNVISGAAVNGKFSYNNISWSGQPGAELSTTGFMLLDGLLPGNNYLWNLDLIKRIGKNIEMNIQYEGRKSGQSDIIHTGRAGIRALF